MSAPRWVRRSRGCGAALAAGLMVLALGRGASAGGGTPDPASRDANYADFWLRLDADRSALQGWFGGTQSWSGFDLGANLVLTQFYPGAWDLFQSDAFNQAHEDRTRAPAVRAEAGPALLFGGLFVQPKLGLGYDFELETLGPLLPQTLLVLEAAFLYVEAWAQLHLYSPFESGLQDSFHYRASVLATCNGHFGFGLHHESTLALRNYQGNGLRSAQLGLAATADVLSALTLGLFAGADLATAAHYHVPVGRFTVSYLF